MFYTVNYVSGSPTIDLPQDGFERTGQNHAIIDYFLISPLLNWAVGVAMIHDEGTEDENEEAQDRLYVMPVDPNSWADDIAISAVGKSQPATARMQQATEMAQQLYVDQVTAINSDMGFVIKVLGTSNFVPPYFPWYLILDGDAVTLQGYNYFWDPDEKFQSVFRDRMGGNHQWLFNWYNLGGRSGVADITEVSCSPAGVPLMKFFWEKEGNYGELLQFVKENCRVQEVPEFNKRSNYIKSRGRKHVEEGEMEPSDALDYALRDLKSAAKRQDPDVFYQEYAQMGFDHPRPDFKDKKWKL